MERERIFGQSNLRTFADGSRVLRTLAAERRRAQRKRAERVQVEEESRALTPAGGIPIVPPAPKPPTPQPPPGASAPVPAVNGVHASAGSNGSHHASVPLAAPAATGAPMTNGTPVHNSAVVHDSAPAHNGAEHGGPVQDPARRPMPQPRVVGPEQPLRDATVRLALEEEAS
jgi:hypothetical protein